MAWYDERLAGFDIETTGVDWNSERIITAALSIVGGGGESKNNNWFINPGIKISEEATAIHGITNAEASEKGKPAKEAIAEIIDCLEETLNKGIPLIIFNARFDLSVLDREARRYSLQPLQERVSKENFIIIDPMILDRATDRWRPGSRTLAAVCDFYNIDFKETHDANSDALAAARLAWLISKKFSIDVPLLELHQRQILWAKKQAKELSEYYKSVGKEQQVDSEWPIVF